MAFQNASLFDLVLLCMCFYLCSALRSQIDRTILQPDMIVCLNSGGELMKGIFRGSKTACSLIPGYTFVLDTLEHTIFEPREVSTRET